MQSNDKTTMRQWVDTWSRADIALQEVKSAELHDDHYYQKNLKLLNGMLRYAVEHGKVYLSSGLVEQQRLFRKFYEKTVVNQ